MALAQDKPSGNAIAALVLGILTFLCFSILTAIPAWIIGKKELDAINAGRSPDAGRTMAQIGMWLGIFGTVLTVLVVLFVLLTGGAILAWLSAGPR